MNYFYFLHLSKKRALDLLLNFYYDVVTAAAGAGVAAAATAGAGWPQR